MAVAVRHGTCNTEGRSVGLAQEPRGAVNCGGWLPFIEGRGRREGAAGGQQRWDSRVTVCNAESKYEVQRVKAAGEGGSEGEGEESCSVVCFCITRPDASQSRGGCMRGPCGVL